MKKTILFAVATVALSIGFTGCTGKSGKQTAYATTQTSTQATAPNSRTATSDRSGKTFTENDLRFHQKPVILTKHARCRMDCRHIDASEIQEMLTNGVVNKRKSGQSKDEATCPTQAIEGKTHDNQTVRIVVAECDTKAKIVTVIDLKNDFKCSCE